MILVDAIFILFYPHTCKKRCLVQGIGVNIQFSLKPPGNVKISNVC